MPIETASQPLFESLVSPGPDKNVPIYNWHAFKHSYSKKLVEILFEEFRLKPDSWVLDPFCGGGTTLLSSKESGFNALGIDVLPFSVFLSNVKVQDYDETKLLNDLIKLRISLKRRKRASAKLPTDIGLLDKAFHPDIRDELLRIKSCINSVTEEKNRNFFNLAFLSTLEAVSNTSKDGGFLRIIERQIIPEDVSVQLLDRCASMFIDVLRANNSRRDSRGSARAILGDARKLNTTRTFDAVITSPPYPNRHDYTRIYALEMAFDFISGNDDLKDIRYKTLRSHVEARKQHQASGYTQPEELSQLLKEIEKNGVNNIQVVDMLKGYFEDMHLAIGQMKEHLNEKAKIALVVSNVRFSGVNIPVDTILAQIGLDAGLKSVKVWTARNRGNSAQQMKTYSRKPSRESIVIWQN